MKVAVSGASGLIGAAVLAQLQANGDQAFSLVRREPGAAEIFWDPSQPLRTSEKLDAIIHLAGEPIGKRFTAAHLQRVRDSRVGPTKLLATSASELGVSRFVAGSAVGYYGAQLAAPVTETSPAGNDDLAEIVAAWEQAARAGVSGGTKLQLVRTGVVLSAKGGALAKQLPIFKAGLGGPIGDGKNWLSWVSLPDIAAIFVAAARGELPEVVNGTAPNPVTNQEFTKTLASVLNRPAVLPVPKPALGLLFGSKGAQQLAAANQQVLPQALVDAGFKFQHPNLAGCLANLG